MRASVLAWVLVLSAVLARSVGADGADTALFAAAIVSGAFYFAREAIEELVTEYRVGIEFLMTAAIVGAAALGAWTEAALVAALYSISEALEGYTFQKTRFAIRGLMDLLPPRARVLEDGREREVDVKDVRVGARIQIRPGENIPVDGIIREGASTINESAVTGESLSVDRGIGGVVFAGTMNGNGALIIEATKAFEDNTVSKIIALVERAQSQKGDAQLLVERFGRIYSPCVLATSILVAAIPWALGLDVATWLPRAVSLLVAASPCALAVSTPVTLVAAIGSAAKRGILIKGGSVIEALGQVQVVALDKTGTLTTGQPSVTGITAISGDEDEVLRCAAAVERLSEHPLAAAILREAEARRLSVPAVANFEALTSAGVHGRVAGELIAVLKPSAARERGAALVSDVEQWLSQQEATGNSVVVVVRAGRTMGLIALADQVRPEARGLVRSLHRAGVRKVVMLTGDNIGTARAIAEQVGIDEYHAGLLPEGKVQKIRELHATHGPVAMVGDGINDAPALAEATVGIAMGTAGSDAALAASDLALIADDLTKLSEAILHAKRADRIVRQNITMSLLIVAVLVAGTFALDLRMLTAVLGHEASELLIVLNGLRAALPARRPALDLLGG